MLESSFNKDIVQRVLLASPWEQSMQNVFQISRTIALNSNWITSFQLFVKAVSHTLNQPTPSVSQRKFARIATPQSKMNFVQIDDKARFCNGATLNGHLISFLFVANNSSNLHWQMSILNRESKTEKSSRLIRSWALRFVAFFKGNGCCCCCCPVLSHEDILVNLCGRGPCCAYSCSVVKIYLVWASAWKHESHTYSRPDRVQVREALNSGYTLLRNSVSNQRLLCGRAASLEWRVAATSLIYSLAKCFCNYALTLLLPHCAVNATRPRTAFQLAICRQTLCSCCIWLPF